jgi:protein PsiE
MIDRELGNKGLRIIEEVGLVIIVIATLVAVGQEIWVMVEAMKVRLADLLLLFIYLEVIAMVGIYFKSHRLPVRFPLYIAMVALARYLILDSKEMSAAEMMAVAGAMLVLGLTVLVVRWGHVKFPYQE